MSQQYWIKVTADGEEFGPYTGPELKQYAAEGRLLPESLVTLDHAKWYEARRVKGLFAPAAAPAIALPPPLVAAAPQELSEADAIYEFAPRQAPTSRSAAGVTSSLGYFTPSVGGDFKPLKRRNTIPFFVVAALMFLAGITLTFIAYSGSMRPRVGNGMEAVFIALGAALGFLVMAIPTLILWLVWVSGAHKDLKQMSGGTYDISPGKAVGFSFIPFFDAYWVVYMPWRLSAEVNRHLTLRGLKPISAGTVMGCQITSVVTAMFLPAVTPLMYAVSMWQVQSGLNRLLAAPAA